MRLLGAGIIVLGFIGFWIYVAVYGIFSTTKKLANKETRPEAFESIKDGAKTTGAVAKGMAFYYLLIIGAIALLLFLSYGLGLGD